MYVCDPTHVLPLAGGSRVCSGQEGGSEQQGVRGCVYVCNKIRLRPRPLTNRLLYPCITNSFNIAHRARAHCCSACVVTATCVVTSGISFTPRFFLK